MTLVALLIAGGIVAGYKLEQVYSRHLSASSQQPSAVSHQLPAGSYQTTADGPEPSAANRQPATVPSRQEADG
jgi:hypothetical protein